MIIISCSDDNSDLTVEEATTGKDIISEKKSESLKIWYDNNAFNKNNNVMFDFDRAYEVQEGNAIVVNQLDFDPANESNSSIAFLATDNGFSPLMMVKTITDSESVKIIEHYDFNDTLIFSAVFNSSDDTVKIIITEEGKSLNFRRDNRSECYAGGFGDATMSCMTDMYSGEGWFSVALTVGTAFAPELAVITAVGCAGSALANNECFESF